MGRRWQARWDQREYDMEAPMRLALRTLTASVLAIGLAGVAVTPAFAADDHGQGKTLVAIAPDVYDLLVGAGIAVKPTGDASAAPFMDTVRAKFPITNISDGGDRIDHSGGLRFSTDDVSISTKKFRITLDDGAVSGKVRGSEVGSVGRAPLFTIAATDDPELGAVRLLLTDAAAGAINATFGTALEEGDLFGYATPKPRG
jgi:hypothetical protein